jgi:L-ascorbate metabolism protein UlaG (beta-lactamase superfamily)
MTTMLITIMLTQFTSLAYAFERDYFPTTEGTLEIEFIGHGTLCFYHAGKVVHVDPTLRYWGEQKFPPSDLTLITHVHGDHYDAKALVASAKKGDSKTVLVHSQDTANKVNGATMLRNGEKGTFAGFPVEAVPAYNIKHQRSPGVVYHPQGDGNGYIITFGGVRVYVAGDTEDIPEMKRLGNVDIAFLPMNLPYTMSPTMCASAARMIGPKVLYPYHYGKTDPNELIELLAEEKNIEIRVRALQ